ncbi:hypothetical protein ACFQZE_19385 [Paenibacillus sp. GCM10027627]
MPIFYASLITWVYVMLVLLVPYLYLLLWETRIDKIENYLLKQKKHRALYFYYLLANGMDQELQSVLSELEAKTKNRQKLALIHAAYGIFKKDSALVKSTLGHISSETYRNYYSAYVQISEGNLADAHITIESLPKPWMKMVMLSAMELNAGNRSKAAEYAKQALHTSRGLQRYVNHRAYERELSEALAL